MANMLYDPLANEPKVRPLIRHSFAFVPSAGMRPAPEVLVLELFRETFFENQYSVPNKTIELDPDSAEAAYSANERAVIYAMQGRRKKARNSKTQRYFAPAYPILARKSGFGKNRERVINNFLLSGPISQHLWHAGSERQESRAEHERFASVLYAALVGHNSCISDDFMGKDILSVPLRSIYYRFHKEEVIETIMQRTGHDPDTIIRIESDELSDRIFKDLISICDLERNLPRMQWMLVLMTYLRFALPLWLLAHMQITSLLHGWLLDAIDQSKIVDTATICREISARNRGLLRPTLTPNRAVFEHIEKYMKHRTELNILVWWLENLCADSLKDKGKDKKLDIDGVRASDISVENLILVARDASDQFRSLPRFNEVSPGLDVRRFLIREGEQFSAWRNPFLGGQGKNIDEFFRVMYRDDQGDEAGGYLLAPEGRGIERGFRIFPGQLLLKTVTYLAARDKYLCDHRGGGGKLVLEDIENHFKQYGVDFTNAAEARPLLVSELQAMGLLRGSPDAGGSVAVTCPYVI